MSRAIRYRGATFGLKEYFSRTELIIMALCLGAVHLSTKVYNYLFFHTVAELFSIFIAVTIFIIVINTADVVKNQYILVVGVSSFFVGLLDTLHTLSYKGMPIFTDYDYYAPQFWIAARYLDSLGMLGAFAFLGSRWRVNVPTLSAGYAVVTGALAASILVTKTFPVCFVHGHGLTHFKMASEYIICAILAASIFLLYLRRDMFDRRVYRLLRLSMIVSIVAELCFTLYVSDTMSDQFNEIGHLLKICAFYLIYKAVVVTGLRDPIALLFRDLKASEENLREAQRLARLGRWEWHTGSGRWDWTDEVGRFLGASSAAPSLRAMLDPLPPQEQSLLRGFLERAAAEGAPFEMMLHLGQGAGEVRFAQLRGEALRQPNGVVHRVIGTLLDVSINQFSIEKSEEAVFWLSDKGAFVYVNNAACQLLGYAAEDLRRLSASDINPAHPQGVFEEIFRELKRSGSMRFEASLLRKDQTSVPVEVCANYMSYAGSDYNVSFVRDMTAYKAAEAALSRANDIYAALSRTNQAIIHSRDRQELFDTVTDVAARYGRFRVAWIGLLDDAASEVRPVSIAGQSRDYAAQLTISLAPGSPTADGPVARCVRTGQAQVVNDFPHVPGTWHRAAAPFGLKSAGAFPIIKRRRTIGVLTLYSDASDFFTPDLVALLVEMAGDISFGLERLDLMAENERQDEELRAAVERLTVSNSELERFAYVAAHDLQEPVRNIVSFAQLVQRHIGDSLSPEDRENCAFVVDSARRLSQLINGLLAYSRVNAKDIPFSRVDLRQACDAAADNLREAILESGAEIAIGALPEVTGDAVQLTQMFQNLIGNAIKFSRPGNPPRVAVSAERRDREWVVTVTDNGIGIADTDQDIFDLFRRLHTVSTFPGAGIGLSICKRIAQRHGGSIWYERNPSQGTAFRFTLPAGEPSVPEVAAVESLPMAAAGG